jgi:hypothetical protein
MNNPSAFPQPEPYADAYDYLRGMTLRDYFATAALTGLISQQDGYIWKDLAPDAYRIADAMLKARREKSQ